MRSRFLTTNYFSSQPETLYEDSSSDLSFLTLPTPHFPPQLPDLPSAFDPLSPIHRPRELIVPLSTAALSSFIDAVVPHRVEVSLHELIDELRVAGVDDREIESGETFVLEAVGVEYGDYKASDGILFTQYETPEPNYLQDTSDFFGNDALPFLSDLPEIENRVGSCGSSIDIQYSGKVVESIYSINNISSEYLMKQKACLLDYGGPSQDQMHYPECKFPLFEVDEMTDESLMGLLMENNLLSLLNTTEIPHRLNLTINCEELLGSMDSNVLELLSDHLQSKHFLESLPEFLKISSDMELMNILDTSYLQEHPSYHHEAADIDHLLSLNPLMFQEFQILDVNASFESFGDIQTVDEPETCDQIFGKGMNITSFNQLIVCHELALVDNTFMSLPVPILSDFEKLRSPHVIIESVFSDLKLMPLSASCEIYLDWHLFEGVAFNSKVSPCNQELFKEIGLQTLDFNLNISDNEKVVFDLYFSDDDLKDPCNEKLENLSNMPSGDVAIHSSLTEVHFTTSGSGQCSSLGTEEKLLSEGVERASHYFKSMSQSNDLDFFLNLQKDAVGKTGKPTKSELESNLAHQRVPSSDSDSTSTPSGIKSQKCNIPYSSAVKAHCEGVDMALNIEIPHGHMQKMIKEDEQLNFIPLREEINMKLSYAEDGIDAQPIPLPVSGDSLAGYSGQIQESLASLPVIIVIANTKSNDKEMIISRRSTYQKILAVEKEGVQLVERDSDLPVDIIVSATTCLVWYNSKNIGNKTSESDVASSSLPSCIEYIATNILTLLSYSFSSCILGEVRFLGSVMDSADGLYASAASLGIHVQLFFSYSSELTDEIILSCVKHAARFTSSLLSKMADSENHAESFLTKFPSINPLTGHAILSSGGTLAEFLGWSPEYRIDAIEKYHVSSGSVALFSILCKYGEREDSKSIMTDCSSSVSSGPDSEISCHYKDDYEIQRRNPVRSPQTAGIPVVGSLHFEPVKQYTKGISVPSKASKPYEPRVFNDTEIPREVKDPSSSLNCLLAQKQSLRKNALTTSSKAPKTFSSQIPEVSQVYDELEESDKIFKKSIFGSQVIDATMRNKLDWCDKVNSGFTHDSLTDKIIDITVSPVHYNDLSWDDNNMNFLNLVPEIENSTRGSNAARRLSFGQSSCPAFPSAADISSASSTWTSERNQGLEGGHGGYLHTNGHKEFPDMYTTKISEVSLEPKSSEYYLCSPFQERMISSSGETPLSKAIHSSKVPHDSPWTLEFLNRIKEKSRLRQKSLPCDTSASKLVYPGNISKASKRRSPSILEFFKYQGGRTMNKLADSKRQKHSVKSSSSRRNDNTSRSLLSWTPVDKRARQTLSFARNGAGSQTKLVWGDGNAYRGNKKFRRQ